MSRLLLNKESKTEKAISEIYEDLGKKIRAFPVGNCPIETLNGIIKLCHSQSCGKCVPCRIGLARLSELIDKILDGDGNYADLELIKSTAETIYHTSDCAIGYEIARLFLDNFDAFKDDFVSHVENNRCTENFKSVPCTSNCPAHVDVPGYIALVGAKRYADAVRLIRKDNPFPSVCALICEHPCEHHCRRNLIDAPLNIRGLKRMAIDNAGKVEAPKCAEATGKTIAIVGGGPSGLTVAYYLTLMGHKVTVFEQKERLGGMLRYGIPLHRLPNSYLDNDIETILSTGIEVKNRVRIGRDFTIEELREKYDAVYISIGAQKDNKLGIEGENFSGVISAIKFLGDVEEGKKQDFCERKVVVIGGGNVAMDATRTAIRLGAESVKIVYRRRTEDMTALPEEVISAIAEGAEILELKLPVRICGENGKMSALVVKPQIIGEIKNGKPIPNNADLPEEIIPADTIIVAVGQSIESSDFENEGFETKHGKIVTENNTKISNKDGIFAGGDAVTGPATVIRAIEAGKVAAANIDEYLGFHTEIKSEIEIPLASFGTVSACGRVNLQEREAKARKNDFELIEKSMTEEEAKQECLRCLHCDIFGHAGFAGGRCDRW